ncbi:mucin-1 [Pogona vitticeps]
MKNASNNATHGLNVTDIAGHSTVVPPSTTASTGTTQTTASPTVTNSTASRNTMETTTSPTVTNSTASRNTMETTTSPTVTSSTTSTVSGTTMETTTSSGTTHSTTLSTSSQHTSEPTTATTSTVSVLVLLTFRITNRNYSSALLDRNSQQFKNLDNSIGQVYNSIYNCSTCPLRTVYLGYYVTAFRPGSVVVDSEINFRSNSETSKPEFAQKVEETVKNATDIELHGLKLTDIAATDSTPPTSSSPTVPGWGIALLVLVCFLVLLALIAFLLLIIYWCRRHQRGSLDLLSSRDSYHPMSDYPTYQTHGRYAAPNSKPNPYNETLPRNGARGFSYTNPAMANDNL